MTDPAPESIGSHILREKVTIEKMISYYCKRKHKTSGAGLCEECTDLLAYAHGRLDNKPSMRDIIRNVMRFSGPRMMIRSPIEWIRHSLHEHSPGYTQKS
jgi:hypothetical protein